MKATVTDYVNKRVGQPSVNAPCYQYVSPGSELILEDKLYTGDFYNGINTWLKDEAGNFYWSGAIHIAPDFPNHDKVWYLDDFGIPEVWKITKGENVTVVLIDSGIYSQETDLPGTIEELSILEGELSDKCGHGTSMLSILKGYKNFLGIAPAVNLQSIKMTDTTDIQPANLIKSLKLLKSIVKDEKQYVVNCSMAIENPTDHTKPEIQDLISEISLRNNIVFCAAVGNWGGKTIPAALDNIISVAGIKKENDRYVRLDSSNYWNSISLACPGMFNLSFLNNTFTSLPSESSSSACAYATGLIALLCSARLKHGRKTNALEIKDLLAKVTTLTTATNTNNYTDAVLDKKKLLTQIT